LRIEQSTTATQYQMMTVLQKFASRFNKSSKSKPISLADINALEKTLDIRFPLYYKEFVQNFGDVFTPDILHLIVSKDLDLHSLQEFWDTESILWDKKNEWTSKLSVDLIPFALDSSGNIFAFKTDDIRKEKQTADIYFFDHDFDTIEKISDSFTKWLDAYNRI